MKQFKVPSPTQEALLAAFEEEGWPAAIDDPLPPISGQDPKSRMRNTIRHLNANQKNRLLYFRGDGSGQRILWEPPEDAADQPIGPRPTVLPRRIAGDSSLNESTYRRGGPRRLCPAQRIRLTRSAVDAARRILDGLVSESSRQSAVGNGAAAVRPVP